MQKPFDGAAALALSPVIPIVTIEDASTAPALARALLSGGITTFEITLRTPAALDAIRAVAQSTPEIVIGAGTVLTSDDLDAAARAGARYALSPGATPDLLEAARKAPIPFIPGVATASEIMAALERGYRAMKFFPAEQLGGAAALKALGAPLPQVQFCATGGITLGSAPSYLALRNVPCVGGSWVTPSDLIARGDWTGIEARARQAAQLRR